MIVQLARKRSFYEAFIAHRQEVEIAIERAIQDSAANNPQVVKTMFSKTRTDMISKAA